MTLADLNKGQVGSIIGFDSLEMETVLMELGMSENQLVEVVSRAPFKGPIAVHLGSSVLSMRLEEARCVFVNLAEKQ